MTTGILTRSLVLLLFLFLAACGGKEKKAPETSRAPRDTAASAIATPSGSQGFRERVKIKDAADARVFDIKLGDVIKIESGAEGTPNVLRGEMRPNGKRKYEMEGGMVLAEVKSDADAFKLRTQDGRLLWKIKLGDGSVKISNNEENTNAFKLKSDGERVKVEDGTETEIGKATWQADKKRVKVKDAADTELFQIDADRLSIAYGVLLLKDIPQTERSIIMAELLARGL
jgi:hypothetical protein